jgi:adenylate cyclase
MAQEAATPRVERRLAAIVAVDVVGYSRLMELDETGTLGVLKARRKEVLEPLVAQHQGRIFKVAGDGVLVEFASAVNAVECAVGLQRSMAAANAGLPDERHIVLRVGVNLGDIIVEGSDLYGEGVNIAARLETMAEPGGVLVSGTAFDHVRNKVDASFDELGAQTLKNIAEPVRAYRVTGTPIIQATAAKTGTDKPSVVVLPFANMSGDAEQEFFSDGITEDIITDLSKASALSVVARNTGFTFKGKAVDICKIAKLLHVSYVLEGSVRKAGGRVRISAQLIDGRIGDHVWAERYDRDLKDIFALQDEISQAVVAALKIRLLPAEKKAIEARPTNNPEAYELYLLAQHHFSKLHIKSLETAVRLCRRSLEIDANYARAWALLAACEARLRTSGRSEESGLAAAESALALDPSLAEAHAAKGWVLMKLGRYEEALTAHVESLRLEPDSRDVRSSFGFTCFQLGRYEEAIEHFERAAQLLETDFTSLYLAAMSYAALGWHEGLESATRRSFGRIQQEVAAHPDNPIAMAFGAINLAQLGETDLAKQWATRALATEPDDPGILYNLACALARIGQSDQALDVLESCIPKLSPEHINWMIKDTDLIPLHGHPRYQSLVARGEARLAAAHV